MFYATCLANVNICPLYTAYNQLLPIIRHLLPRDTCRNENLSSNERCKRTPLRASMTLVVGDAVGVENLFISYLIISELGIKSET